MHQNLTIVDFLVVLGIKTFIDIQKGIVIWEWLYIN